MVRSGLQSLLQIDMGMPHNGSTLSGESALEVLDESTATAARPHEPPFPEPEGRRN